MKIAHFIDSGGLYGAEKMLLTLCKEQIKQGLDPLIVSCGVPNEGPKAIELACYAAGISCLAWRMSAGLNIKGFKLLLETLQEKKIDIFHSHGYKFNILFCFLELRGLKSKKITTIHGYIPRKPFTKGWLYQALDRIAVKTFDHIVYVNDIDKIKNSPRSRSRSTIYNGIEFNSESNTQKKDIKYKIAYFGRLSEEKGANLLPKALLIVNKKIQAISLDIYGEGPDYEFISKEINATGLSPRITLKGYTNNVTKEFKNYDLIVMPSKSEGLPMISLEAINSNTPIICTRVGGLPNLLGQDYPYFISHPPSPENIANSIINFYVNGFEISRNITKALKIKAARNYSSSTMSSEYTAIYKKIS
ncbi:glycosyltransferase [Simiduia sp. 21SJ11W-1]|uniref:glycosyltransferase n=1 Tax=Simiduia sp. 21SJ11W-1 TaxID=2909669 RepID=UPI0020A1C5A9|nr:glycosyltransferase [Simiduia sp. 21SJ11W-1]UTA47365.1 glycosyltransferase [Simiduia sp. 21SJ11W-1]